MRKTKSKGGRVIQGMERKIIKSFRIEPSKLELIILAYGSVQNWITRAVEKELEIKTKLHYTKKAQGHGASLESQKTKVP